MLVLSLWVKGWGPTCAEKEGKKESEIDPRFFFITKGHSNLWLTEVHTNKRCCVSHSGLHYLTHTTVAVNKVCFKLFFKARICQI